jgi:hypothetical protein
LSVRTPVLLILVAGGHEGYLCRDEVRTCEGVASAAMITWAQSRHHQWGAHPHFEKSLRLHQFAETFGSSRSHTSVHSIEKSRSARSGMFHSH